MDAKRPAIQLDFYPRPPRGGRPVGTMVNGKGLSISIHALREEGDRHMLSYTSCRPVFLSTPSARRATLMAGCC